MQTAQAFDKERLEVEALLASGIFNRAPNLAHLLKYVCDKYFEGSAEEIKEYNIAVEALGRHPEFDQKKDSIVRVEAHRLRKRLREYYEHEGAHHELQVEIPSGQYTPKFIAVNSLSQPAANEVEAPLPEAGVAVVPVAPETGLVGAPDQKTLAFPVQRLKWLAFFVFASAVMGGTYFIMNRSHQARIPASGNVLPVALSGDEVRILCGVESGTYTDSFEHTWLSDRFYSGGVAAESPRSQTILGTRDPKLYRTRREGNFRYDIPLKPGKYELRLYFAETMFGDNNAAGGGETTRLFQIRLNGKTLESLFDVIADAGASSTADIKVFRDVSPDSDGKIHLEFLTDTNMSFLNAISIQPGMPGRMRPYRIAARDHGMIDNQGRMWDPDHYARGGQLIARPESNIQAPDPELFRGERFGNLTYSLPVVPSGKYTVNLYFAETWFGPDNPGGGGIGNRIFDILINGELLRKNFDIFKESGGAHRPVVVSRHGIEPTHQGKIVISMVPNRNYACINALEVIDESR